LPIGLTLRFADNRAVRALISQAIPQQDSQEYLWLASEHFENLFLAYSTDDILFGLSTTKSPQSQGPWGRNAQYVASEVGGPLSATSLPRIICAAALRASGMTEFSEAVDARWSPPAESAVQASIEFIDDPEDRQFGLTLLDRTTNTEVAPLDFVSSNALLTQNIVRILENEPLVPSITLGKAFPFRLFGLHPQARDSFSLFNHFWLKLRPGTLEEAARDLLAVALHLNWSLPREPLTKLSTEQTMPFALAQSARLKRLEEREAAVRHAISVLQKRYPRNAELIQFEVNNPICKSRKRFANV
jgi:hypothetical protein